MNILMLADIVPYPPNPGIKIRTFNIIKQLQAHGHNVFLVCFNHKIFINDAATLKACHDALAEFCAEVHIMEIPSDRNAFTANLMLFKNLFQKAPYRVHRYHSREAVDVVKSINERHSIDIVHLDKTEFYIYARYFAGVPCIPTNHNVESRLFHRRAEVDTTPFRRAFSWLQYRKTERYERDVLTAVPLFPNEGRN